MYVHRTNNGKRISQYTCSQSCTISNNIADINRTTINKEAAIKPESIKQNIKIRKYSNLFEPYDSRSAVILFLFDKCFCVCQEGWHRPALSLFAKVSLIFYCK